MSFVLFCLLMKDSHKEFRFHCFFLFSFLVSQRDETIPSRSRESSLLATARVDIRDLLKVIYTQIMQPSNVVCCIMEHHAVVFYVYLGYENLYTKSTISTGELGGNNNVPMGSTSTMTTAHTSLVTDTLTYYLPIKL